MSSAIAHNCPPVRRPHRTLGLWSGLRAMIAITAQRRSLNALDDHMLKDIGVSRSEALKEAQKPIWDVPETWRG